MAFLTLLIIIGAEPIRTGERQKGEIKIKRADARKGPFGANKAAILRQRGGSFHVACFSPPRPHVTAFFFRLAGA